MACLWLNTILVKIIGSVWRNIFGTSTSGTEKMAVFIMERSVVLRVAIGSFHFFQKHMVLRQLTSCTAMWQNYNPAININKWNIQSYTNIIDYLFISIYIHIYCEQHAINHPQSSHGWYINGMTGAFLHKKSDDHPEGYTPNESLATHGELGCTSLGDGI